LSLREKKLGACVLASARREFGLKGHRGRLLGHRPDEMDELFEPIPLPSRR
jgi:hypothetical protein